MQVKKIYHENDMFGGRKHVLKANGAVAMQALLNAVVLSLHTHGHAYVAGRAVEVVDFESLADPANLAVTAVIDGSVRLVLPDVADAAIVPRHLDAAVVALWARGLNGLAHHADHSLDRVPVDLVVVDGVVAETAGEPLAAARRKDLAHLLVVLAASEVGRDVLVRV